MHISQSVATGPRTLNDQYTGEFHVRIRTSAIIPALTLALVMGAAGTAWAGPGRAPAKLPGGWEITDTASGEQLTWHAPHRIAPGDALIQFYAGDRLLGQPVATDNQRTFRLLLPREVAQNITDPQVRAAGRRLDV